MADAKGDIKTMLATAVDNSGIWLAIGFYTKVGAGDVVGGSYLKPCPMLL